MKFRGKINFIEEYVENRTYQLTENEVKEELYKLIYEEMNKWNWCEQYYEFEENREDDNLKEYFNYVVDTEYLQQLKEDGDNREWLADNFEIKNDLTIKQLEDLLTDIVAKESLPVLYYDDQNYPIFNSFPHVYINKAQKFENEKWNYVNEGELVFDKEMWIERDKKHRSFNQSWEERLNEIKRKEKELENEITR
ncbi:hypothetical protein [Mycoplasma sp. CSL7503-lung]|uniref:hypothetical protein n=1 Tax=Mycoplasma sp. CSL7503-lung TaxID=536372 RepID=UPI0021D2C05F|nr:hypothetical protein [Mycoplasma sp. CSL7503-lung]MCU4706440.1 hypothetical protein [Mycoplasma sp. CSL7503-lung]